MSWHSVIHSIDRPIALIVVGALFGGVGWYIPSSWLGVPLVAQVMIASGFAIRPTRRRLILALAVTFLMWWPFWAGAWVWSH